MAESLIKIGRVWLDPDRVDAVSPNGATHAHIILSSGHIISLEIGTGKQFESVDALAAQVNSHRTMKEHADVT